ncbi:MAG: CBS domain-containing protein, partial [Propionivibrio sp.]
MDSRYYGPLRQLPLKAGSTYYLPELLVAAPVTLKSPAIEVMTDLRRIGAVTVKADMPISTAEQLMKLHAVRLLIVVDERRGVLGLITATDILGEKPLALTFERGIRRHEITVQQIMTPAERLVVIEMNSVLLTNVGNVLETL